MKRRRYQFKFPEWSSLLIMCLEGASVIIKGTKTGTTTDASGKFTLDITGKSRVLVISYLGYITQEISISGKTDFRIVMVPADNIGEEIVVGYGTSRKSSVTGSIASLKGRELERQPNYRTDEAIQGRISGVMVQNNSGGPTPNISIRIRGSNSLTFGNDPLVIVDGVQGLSLANINPNDIQSIEVLKDAAALSIYGSRGANGVILVTTKSGSTPFSISYNNFFSFDRVRNPLKLMNATEYATVLNASQLANGYNPMFSPEEVAALGEGTNWQKEILRTGFTQSHNLNISGKSQRIDYFVSGTFNNRTGIIINNDYNAYALRANLNVKASERLSFSLNSFFQSNKANPNDPGGALRAALVWSPTKTIYDSLGRYTQPGGIGPNGIYNPVGIAKESVIYNSGRTLTIAPSAQFVITKNFTVKSMIGYTDYSGFNGYFSNQVVNLGPAAAVGGGVTMSTSSTLQNTNILTYIGRINDHKFDFTGVYEIMQARSRYLSGSSSGIPVNLGMTG